MKIVKVDPRQLDYGIMLDEAKEWFKKHYNISPEVRLRFSNYPSSTGRNTGGWYITITAGMNPVDFAYVIDHEYCHTIDRTWGDPHGDKFHEALLKVTRQRGNSIDHMLRRSLGYKPRAATRLMKRHRLALKET